MPRQNRSDEDIAFILQMIDHLKATIEELTEWEHRKAQLLGPERVEELRQLWNKRLTAEDEDELKQSLDFADKELIWIWSRLDRARLARVNAGREYMLAEPLAPAKQLLEDKQDDE